MCQARPVIIATISLLRRLLRPPDPDLNAAAENADAVGEAEDLVEAVADDQDREVALAETCE